MHTATQPAPRRWPLTVWSVSAAWSWSVLVISTRDYLVHSYGVLENVPAGWGFVAASPRAVAVAVTGGLLLAWGLLRAGPTAGTGRRIAIAWLSLSLLIPALDVLRVAFPALPLTVLEPLGLAAVTGAAVAALVRGAPASNSQPGRSDSMGWWPAVIAATVAAGTWFFFQSQQAYDSFLLGYNDFGQFATRVAATWKGRGFLLEAPGLPPFWDHFNPGLVFLAPLWGLWPDARLFFVVQAVCLASPALLVYALARAWNAPPAAAAAWSLAYLAFPAVSQMNLNFTYGWHPVSCALPFLFAAMWLLARGRLVGALGASVLAASFREDVLVVLSLCCLVLAVAAWRRPAPSDQPCGVEVLAGRLSARHWLLLATVWGLAFLAAYRWAGFAAFQTHRFARLGQSPLEIALSPWRRPRAFWGSVLDLRSGYYVLALVVPLGVRTLMSGAGILVAALVPLGVLLAWDHAPAKSLAFQYATALIPVLFAAALAGSSRRAGREGGAGWARNWLAAGLASLAAGLTASVALGAWPWSSPTLTEAISQTYPAVGGETALDERLPGSRGHALLEQVLDRVRGSEAVLASGRVAAHLLGVPRLETVGQALARWPLVEAEAVGSRRGLSRFDWMVIDTGEQFQQQPAEVEEMVRRAVAAGFRLVDQRLGVLVLEWVSPGSPLPPDVPGRNAL